MFLFRHRFLGESNKILEGSDKITISLKTAGKEMGFGIGDGTRPMCEATVRKKVESLKSKGLIEKTNVVHGPGSGTVIRVKLPTQTEYYRIVEEAPEEPGIEDIDFFVDPVGRKAILTRENSRCFYCFLKLDQNNYVMEHVVSRPEGDSGYRNIVAACRTCNNKKLTTLQNSTSDLTSR